MKILKLLNLLTSPEQKHLSKKLLETKIQSNEERLILSLFTLLDTKNTVTLKELQKYCNEVYNWTDQTTKNNTTKGIKYLEDFISHSNITDYQLLHSIYSRSVQKRNISLANYYHNKTWRALNHNKQESTVDAAQQHYFLQRNIHTQALIKDAESFYSASLDYSSMAIEFSLLQIMKQLVVKYSYLKTLKNSEYNLLELAVNQALEFKSKDNLLLSTYSLISEWILSPSNKRFEKYFDFLVVNKGRFETMEWSFLKNTFTFPSFLLSFTELEEYNLRYKILKIDLENNWNITDQKGINFQNLTYYVNIYGRTGKIKECKAFIDEYKHLIQPDPEWGDTLTYGMALYHFYAGDFQQSWTLLNDCYIKHIFPTEQSRRVRLKIYYELKEFGLFEDYVNSCRKWYTHNAKSLPELFVVRGRQFLNYLNSIYQYRNDATRLDALYEDIESKNYKELIERYYLLNKIEELRQ